MTQMESDGATKPPPGGSDGGADRGPDTGNAGEPRDFAFRATSGTPGDVDGDGDVDMADLTMALARGEDFAAITATLAAWSPAPIVEWRIPYTPPTKRGRGWLVWSLENGCRDEWRSDERSNPLTVSAPVGATGTAWLNTLMPRVTGAEPGVVLSGWRIGAASLGLCPKVKAPAGSDPATRWLLLDACTIEGDGQSVPVAAPSEWGGGVWYRGCVFRDVQACGGGAMGMSHCFAERVTSDLLTNVRAALDITCRTIRKPPGSAAHPDAIQASWSIPPGPMAFKDISVRGCTAQGVFARCSAPLEALCLSGIDIECTEGNGYHSQLVGCEIGALLIDGLRLIGQPFLIRNDGATGRKVRIGRSRLARLDVPEGVFIDPGAGIQTTAAREVR